MKITHVNIRKPEFVTKHEVGKVYLDCGSYYLLVEDKGKFQFVNIAQYFICARVYDSLEQIDRLIPSDILVDCELVIKDAA